MSTQFYADQLQMAWPEQLLLTPPSVHFTPGYLLRTYHPDDSNNFFELMDMAGWNDWDEQRLKPWIPRILSEGWFLVCHQASGRMVASCMALRSEAYSSGGELGWLASDPAHSGKRLGLALSAAVTARFIDEGFRFIHLYTEDFRLAAIKTYLKLGYVPLHIMDQIDRWREICKQLELPFTPDLWNSIVTLTQKLPPIGDPK